MNNRALNHERLTDRFNSIFENDSTTVYFNTTCIRAVLIYTMPNDIYNLALPHRQKLACHYSTRVRCEPWALKSQKRSQVTISIIILSCRSPNSISLEHCLPVCDILGTKSNDCRRLGIRTKRVLRDSHDIFTGDLFYPSPHLRLLDLVTLH